MISTVVNEPIRPLGPDGSSFYEAFKISEISGSYDFFKRYYEIDHRIDPILKRIGERTYLTARGGFYTPAYELDRFDCSEIAALMEYYLERSGIGSKIAYSSDFGGGGHAWVLVDLPGGPYYMDATNFSDSETGELELIAPGDEKYEKYSKYQHLYDNIYELLIDCSSSTERRWLYQEFDWWNSPVAIEDGLLDGL